LPLFSPADPTAPVMSAAVAECDALGGLCLAAGVLLTGALALTSAHPGRTVASTALQAVIYSAVTFIACRVSAARALAAPRCAPAAIQPPARALRVRVAGQALGVIVVCLTGVALGDARPVFAGILAGAGACTLLTGRWLARWERRHHARVLRSSIWGWNFTVIPR
jgi:hypothetical protein